MIWLKSSPWFWQLVSREYTPFTKHYARVEMRLGKWTLEIYRPSKTSPNLPWEFVERFDDLEEAKRVGFTLARIEENT